MHGNTPHQNTPRYDDEVTSLAALLTLRASQFPKRRAFVFEDETGATVAWTYSELDQRAQAVAKWLGGQAERGDRALLVYPAGLDFIAAFFGCLYAGVLPVPATYPKPRRPLPRLDSIAADCKPSVVLTHSSVLSGLCLDQQSPAVANLNWQPTDLLEPIAGERPDQKFGTDDLAFLQYTSGSTSEPRGVMISHGNLLHNLETIRQGFEIARADAGEPVPSGVFWLPAYHDMGLIGGILTPIFVGGTSYLLAPTTFLRRPQRWVELLSETGAQISGAPNFGYEFLVQKTDQQQRAQLDLSNWRLAFCGAEPIHPSTLQDFAEAFAVSGFREDAFYPCYGMAEVTLLVSGGKGSDAVRVLHVDRDQLGEHKAVPVEVASEQSHSMVGCGASLDGQRIEIVDPQTATACDDGRVGEIWVRGRSVSRGYWQRDDVNREVFGACLSDNGDEPFLRTGDLGFEWDGELYITGRLKDVIIIRGRNHYPQDIERTATKSHVAVGMGAAFSVETSRAEQLVVVHQIEREHRKADLDEVIRAVRAAIVEEHELDPHAIVLIKPVSLPITSSGKVQRQRCYQQYLAGELAIAAEWTAEPKQGEVDAAELPRPEFLNNVISLETDKLVSEIEGWLIRWLTIRADLNPSVMQPDTPFAELGIDSLTAVEISQDMDQCLELQLPPMMIWSCPTSRALASYLATELVAVRKGESTTA
ncbi:MAG: AMP-binding protein [Planctomycetota bacterium]